jgi:hypothetical protein
MLAVTAAFVSTGAITSQVSCHARTDGGKIAHQIVMQAWGE